MAKIFVAPPSKAELSGYIEWLEALKLPYIVSVNPLEFLNGDLLLLCGGIDVYSNHERDSLEFRLLMAAENFGNNVVGICRGMQISNVFFGGTLIRELDGASDIMHRLPKNLDGSTSSAFHNVTDILTGEIFPVNSRHHQSIKDVGDKLIVRHKAHDGVIESAYTNDGRYHLVQWHPEKSEVRNTRCSTYVSDFLKIGLQG